MALTVEVRINNKLLTYIKAERITKNKQNNSYNVSIPDFDTVNWESGEVEHWIKLGFVRHRYDDGANVLAKKMLKILEENKNGNTI